MNNQILALLKRTFDSLPATGDPETKRNALKEELQYYVLDFIYHHPEYSKWIMYGGSALRICHGLDRMSVDLDFEVPHIVAEPTLEILKTDIEDYFADTYSTGKDFLHIKITGTRGLTLKFDLGDAIPLGHTSNQLHLKIDLNHFVAPKTVTERIPIQHDQLSFVILTYNMSSLMASKIAAIFLRGERSVGRATYEEKGRDIYDLLWYMNQKIVPDLDYLRAKNVGAGDLRVLFDKLTLKMNDVNNTNLRNDLEPLFLDRRFIQNWLENWLDTYLRLVGGYKIRTITTLSHIRIFQDFNTDVFYFIYEYATEETATVRLVCKLSDYWIDFADGKLPFDADTSLDDRISFDANGSTSHPASKDDLRRYATLFLKKVEKYLQNTRRVILGDGLETKVIRMTASKLNQKEEIVLTKSALISCELEDLLK